MLILTGTTDILEVVTGTAADVDVVAVWMDHTLSSDNYEAGRTPTAITTATTTTIVAAPGAGVTRNVKTLHIRNKDSADTTDVTVQLDVSGTNYELHKVSLAPGEALEYVDGVGFFELTASVTPLATGAATTAQIASHSADTYYIGIPVTSNGITRLRAGSWFRWTFGVTKGAAGTATPTFNIRFGTAGTTGDTSRCLMTMSAQTAASDSGYVEVEAVLRTIGATAVIVGKTHLHHQLATTGLNSTTTGNQIVQTVGASFDSTVNNSIIGLSVNPGTSGAWVVESVVLDAVNLVF